MNITRISNGVLCDMGGCTRKAAYAVGMEGKPLSTRLNLCPQCAKQLQGLLNEELGKKGEVSNGQEAVRGRDS